MAQVTVKTDIPQTVNYQSCTVQAGTTTTLASDQNATVTNAGTEYNAVLNFGIPRGKSAYEQAVEGGYQGTEEEFEQAIASDIATVADNISGINAVGQSITEVNAVADNLTDVSTVADNVSDINTVAGISSDVSQVAGISAAVNTVSAHDSEVTLVSDNMASVMATASNIGDIQTVAGIASDVSTVAGIASDVSAVEDIKTDISAVVANSSNINAVAGNESNINAVNANKTNIDAVAGNSTNINAVAGNESNINAVNANKANIDTVAGNSTNITTVATNISSVNTAATNMAAIIAAPTAAQNAATSATNAQTWAEGTDTAVTALGGEHSSKGWANVAKQYAESIGAALKYKGSVANYASLPSTGQEVGDMWNVLDTGKNYAWTGTEWDDLSGVVDLSAYRTAANQDIIDGNLSTTITNHTGNTNNPHSVTASQVGLGNVDNTSDLNKPISTATQTALDGKQATLVSGTNIKTVNGNSLLGSGNVDIDALPSQTGQNGKFLTTDGTDASWSDKPLVNTATQSNSLAIGGSIGTNTGQTVVVGQNAQASYGSFCTAVGASATASIVGGSNGLAVGYNASVTKSYATQLGNGTNSDANTFKVGNQNGNFELMSADGTIPVARLNTMTGATAGAAGAKGAVPAPSAGDNEKFLRGDGTWANVDALPSQTGNQGKYLTTDGTSASWDIPMAGLPMFYATYQPRKLNNASWLRADPYSWHSADLYVSAYAHLADNISGVTAETETIAGTTITYYRLSDEIKVVLPDQQTNLDTIYNATGIGYYFVLDTTNRQFKLPRNTYGFTGYRGDVGGYVAESLPSFVALCGYDGQTGAYRQKTAPYTYRANTYQTNTAGVADIDATYGSEVANKEDAPVQQRATQAYLYFYVGNTVQNETSVDVAELAEDLNDKADIDLGNLSNAGKIVSAKMSMPGDIYIDITPSTSGATYTALSDGYFLVNAYITSAGGWFSLRRPANGYMGFQVHNPYQGAVTSGFLPVKKGDVITLDYAGISFNDFRFIYAEGSESEA